MSDDAIYRYFGKNPSYEGGATPHDHAAGSKTAPKTAPKTTPKTGGTITVLPCGVITFSGSFTPAFADFVGFVGGHDSDLADEIAAMADSDDSDATSDIASDAASDTGSILVFGLSDNDVSDRSIKLAPRMDEIMMGIHETIGQSMAADDPDDMAMGILTGTPTGISTDAPFDITTI